MRNAVLFLASLLFSLMLLSLINNPLPSPTGYAAFATKEQAKSVIGSLASESSTQLLGEGAQICIVVQIDANNTYYYKITSSGGSSNVEEAYCADPGQDNLIVKFNSYDDLLSARSGSKTFITEKRNTGYYIFPSNYVQIGGIVQCAQSFQQKYCAILYNYFTKQEMTSMDLSCCANYELTAEQQATLQAVKAGKPSTLQSPIDFLFSTTGIIAVIAVIVIIVVASSLVIAKPKNPLADYVKTTRVQGYGDEDIKNTLAESGWDEKTIDEALKRK